VTVTVDINILLDVFQRRQPHYAASAHVISMAETGALKGICPAHGLTTLYYIVRKVATKQDAEAAMDRVLDHFQIGNLDASGWREARSLPMDDFEDATVAAVAKASGSDFIITRDHGDFARSPVAAISPADFLIMLAAKP
jgi:predicted nucleic acid-binding protein